MQFGYLTHDHAEGVRPDVLAYELEARGFDSIWVPEHSHIPVESTGYPGGPVMPDSAWKTMDPFVSLATAAAASTRLLLGTGVCLALQHDLVDLACTVATLDVLSGGRVALGIGAGWNAEELAHHRADIAFGRRYEALAERAEALRTLWEDAVPRIDGEWHHLAPSRVEPKPMQARLPIALGGAGPIGMRHAARWADAWCPIDVALTGPDGRSDVAAGIERFRRTAAECGRDPEHIPVTLFAWGGTPSQRRVEEALALDVERMVFMPPMSKTHSADRTMAHLDELAGVVTEYRT